MNKKIYWFVVAFLTIIANVLYADVTALSLNNPVLIKQLYMPNGNVVMGNPKGKVTLVEFFGYDCRYCRGFYPQLQTIIAAHPDLRVVYKEYLVFGKLSQLPAIAALAAARQGKYAQMHDTIMSANKPLTKDEILTLAEQNHLNIEQFKKDMSDPLIGDYVTQNIRLATQLGLRGIPQIIVAPTAVLNHPDQYTQYLVDTNVDTKSVNEAIKKAQDEIH